VTPLDPYQKKLFVFLGVATFFEGYDFFALAQLLPNLRADLGLSATAGGLLVTVINVGTVLAYLLVRQGDRWGRRRVLTITIVGYTLSSLLTAAAPNAIVFAIAQLVGRIFLIGEWATAMVVAAEEFPADRRGMVIGIIQAMSSLGSILCAALVPTLLKTPLGWRSVYLVGAVPLVVVAFARRGLRETARFEQVKAARGNEAPAAFTSILRGPHRGRVLRIALAWGLTYVCTQCAITFWKEFAMAERNMTDGEVATAITIAAVGSLPVVLSAGKLLDVFGRKRSAIVIFLVGSASVVACYTLHGTVALTIALAFGIAGVNAVLPVLNAYTAELFPTELRSDAYAWGNNLLGRIGYVVAPVVVGLAAERVGWGTALASTAVFPILALVLVLVHLPETGGKELEETATV
jgi:MFS transporter, putative metabolite:H+ symporter